MSQHLSEQEIVRRESLQKIREMGIDPYPAAMFDVTAHAATIKAQYEEEILEDGTKNRKNFQDITLSGRIMAQREAGKAMFMNIQDSTGQIQLYMRGEEVNTAAGRDDFFPILVKKLLDIGDFVGIKGFAFKTKTGEVSVHVKEFTLLSKSLRPLPIVKDRKSVV